MSDVPHSELERVRTAAVRLRGRRVDDPLARTATLEDPIAVVSTEGDLDSWLVALTTEGRLLGFLQLEPDLRLHRYASFQHTPGTTDGCPPAAVWLDRGTILERARVAARAGDELGQPVLGFAGNRDRVAWRVPVANRPADIYVVGEHAYEAHR